MREDRIFRYQYIMLMILAQVGSVFLVSIQESSIGKDAWIALLPGIAIGLISNFLFLSVLKKNNWQPFFDMNKKLFGRAGNIITVLYCIYFLLGSGLLLNYYGVFTSQTILHDMPVPVVIIAITAVISVSSLKGVSAMGRMGVAFSFLLLGFIAVSFLTELPYADIKELKPVFSCDRDAFFKAAVLFGFLQAGDIISIFCLAPYVKNQKRLVTVSLLSSAAGISIVFVFCFLNALVLGDSLMYQHSGFLRVMKLVNLGGILNRLEALVVAGYFFATVFRLMAQFFVVTNNMDIVFNKKNIPFVKWGIFTVCAAAIIIFSSNIAVSQQETEDFAISVCPFTAAVFQFIVPIIMLAVSKRVKRQC